MSTEEKIKAENLCIIYSSQPKTDSLLVSIQFELISLLPLCPFKEKTEESAHEVKINQNTKTAQRFLHFIPQVTLFLSAGEDENDCIQMIIIISSLVSFEKAIALDVFF